MPAPPKSSAIMTFCPLPVLGRIACAAGLLNHASTSLVVLNGDNRKGRVEASPRRPMQQYSWPWFWLTKQSDSLPRPGNCPQVL